MLYYHADIQCIYKNTDCGFFYIFRWLQFLGRAEERKAQKIPYTYAMTDVTDRGIKFHYVFGVNYEYIHRVVSKNQCIH